MTLSLLLLLGAGALVIIGGLQLARAGDEIAARARISRLLVGVLLVGVATSLPEAVVGVTAGWVGAPDLAMGNLLGESLANIAVLGLVDLLHRGHVLPRVELGHARVASGVIVLTAVISLGMLRPTGVVLGWVGLETILVAIAYAAGIAWMRRSPAQRFGGTPPVPRSTGWATTGVNPWPRFVAATALIFLGAPVLTHAARDVAEVSGVGETFLATTLLALVTASPELVAAIAAVRMGAFDIAVGNLFGSVGVNLALLLLVDVAYTQGPLLQAVGPGHLVSAIGLILLSAMALAALVHGFETRIARLEPDAVLLLVTYGVLLWAMWSVGGGP